MLLAGDPLPVWILPALAAAFYSIAVRIGNRRDAKRLVALKGVAGELGLQFAAYDNSIPTQWGGCAINPRGDFPMATSVMRGTRGLPVVLFDYTVKIGTSNNKSLLQRTVNMDLPLDRPLVTDVMARQASEARGVPGIR